MKVIEPNTITEAKLLSSTVPEDDAPAYAAGTTYAMGANVVFSHRVWESLSAGNIGNTPDASPAFWLELGPTNRWAVFDTSSATQTVASEVLEFVVRPGRFDALSLFGVDAATVRVRRTTSVGVIYDQTFAMAYRTAPTTKWSEYFFNRVYAEESVMVAGLLVDGTATLTITLSKPGGTVRVGGLVTGLTTDLGLPLANAKAGIVDYSRKDVDTFGRAIFVKRAFAKTMALSVKVPAADVDMVASRLAALRATPALWIARDGDYQLLSIFGFYRDFSISVAYATHSICELTIEGIA